MPSLEYLRIHESSSPLSLKEGLSAELATGQYRQDFQI